MRQSAETVRKIRILYESGQLPLLIRGRSFGLSEIRQIHLCTELYHDEGRTRISKEVCERLDWRQPNGWLKDRACRDVLRQMSDVGVIELPDPKTNVRRQSLSPTTPTDTLGPVDLETPINGFPDKIELEFAKGNKAEGLWNDLVDRYHYLGHRVAVGRSIKYLINSEVGLLGAISFSSASWHLQPRDDILRQLGHPPNSFREIVINNSRFLILPRVSVTNLASRLLSMATKRVAIDWSWYYSIEPLFVETFVELARFNGSCYKAANWHHLGMTKGYAKIGSSYRTSQAPKSIFLYGLNRKTRRLLERISRDSLYAYK